jgi:heat shock protein HslJ
MSAGDESMTARRREVVPAAVRTCGWRRGGRPAARLFLLALALLGGCSGSGGTAPDNRPLRTDVEWQLVSLAPAAGPTVTVADPGRYTVRFGSDGSVAARADCNRCGGRYRIEGAALTVGPALACTRAACVPPSLGDQFTAALAAVSTYIQREGELELVYAGGSLRFRAAP